MNEKIMQQFFGLKSLINSNLESIKMLLNQAKQLEDLANSFSSNGGDSEHKTQLNSIVTNIYSTIESLLEQTDRLFDEYKALLNGI